MSNLLAATIDFSPTGGSFTGPADPNGVFGNPTTGTAVKFELLFTKIIAVMTVVAGIWFIFILFIGAIGWMTAGGDKGAVETARKRIANGLTGLVIVVIAIFIASLVGQILGFKILDLANFINNQP